MGAELVFDIETRSADERWQGHPDFIRLCGWASEDDRTIIGPPKDLLLDILAHDVVIGHNIMAYDLPVLVQQFPLLDIHRLAREERLLDTMILAMLNDPPSERMKAGQIMKAYSLDALTGMKLGNLKAMAKLHGGYEKIPVDDPDYVAYLVADVEAARALSRKPGMYVTPYVLREHRVAAIAAQISLNGFRVDLDLLHQRLEHGARVKAEGIEKLQRVYGLPTTKKDGKPVTSPQATEAGKLAIAEAFRSLKVRLPRTKTDAPALGQDIMDTIIEKYDNPEVIALAELVKGLNGVRTVYQTVEDHRVGDRVHPDITMFQVSGRWSITKPGLTVMGKHGGRHVEREIFLAEPGEVILSVDLSQVDARAIAGHSQDHQYMNLFEPGRDLHSEISTAVWGDDSRRQDAKVIGHGWNYGMGAKGLAKASGLPIHEAEQFDARMSESFPRLVEWRNEVRERAEMGSLLDNGFGRLMRPNPDRAWTQGPALYGQGTARDIMMEGLLRLPSELLPMLRAVVHDEVVLSVPAADVEEVSRTVVESLSFDWCPPHGHRAIEIKAEVSGKPSASWGGVYDKVISVHTHVFPVDPTLTADEAWRELCIFGRRMTFTGDEEWAIRGCDGEECRGIEEEQ